MRAAKAGFLLILTAAISTALGGCGRKVRHFTPEQAVQALASSASEVRTARGRAFVSARSTQDKASFPSVVVLDRANASNPRLRIEAMDPLGATHVLILLKDDRLTWIDFDQKRIFVHSSSWNGLPLSKLPELLLGVATLSPEAKVMGGGSGEEQALTVRAKGYTALYRLEAGGSGIRLAGIESEASAGGKYSVEYSRFLGKPDHHLPESIKIRAESQAGSLDIKVDWRERKWNDDLPDSLFTVPAGAIKGFTTEVSR